MSTAEKVVRADKNPINAIFVQDCCQTQPDDNHDDADYKPKEYRNLQGAFNKPPEIQGTGAPTKAPTKAKDAKTSFPTNYPTKYPTKYPTNYPTRARKTSKPTKPSTMAPTNPPTAAQTTAVPTKSPTKPPTMTPTNPPTGAPTKSPTKSPTFAPTDSPSAEPSIAPTYITKLPPLAPEVTTNSAADQDRTNGASSQRGYESAASSSTYWIAGIVGLGVLVLLSVALLIARMKRKRRASMPPEPRQQPPRTLPAVVTDVSSLPTFSPETSTRFQPRVAGEVASTNSSSRPWFADDFSMDEYTYNNTMGDDDAQSLDFSLEGQSVLSTAY